MFNGHGIFMHSSNYYYEGLFENGLPFQMASKLAISMKNPMIEEASSIFDVEVKALTQDSKIFNGLWHFHFYRLFNFYSKLEILRGW
jgi:hypothetical protein